eukprot:m.125421 g.125421  ORF g.125421 m.125421 type:complete len:351 (+) comp15738_c1_seq2:54-1106(+)
MRWFYQGLALATIILLVLQLRSMLQPRPVSQPGRFGIVDYGDPFDSLQRLKQEAKSNSIIGMDANERTSNLTGDLASPLWRLPQLLVIGFMKSGTSALYYALCEHPSVACAAYVKEPFYLSAEAASNYLQSYQNMLDVQARKEFHLRYLESCFNMSNIKPHQLTLEASTTYIHSSAALSIISERLLNANTIRLLVMVREPVSRAYSQYNHEQRRKKTTAKTFEEAVLPEYTIIKRCHEQDEWMANQGQIVESKPYASLYECIKEAATVYARQHQATLPGYLFKSLYLWHLRPWMRAFKSRLKVMEHQQYRRHTVTAMDEVQDFLDIPFFDYTQVQDTITHEFQEGSRYGT